MFIETDNIKLYYDIGGGVELNDGKPVMLVLPGGPGRGHDSYKKYSLEFEECAHVVYFDPRGCGRSDATNPSSFTMKNYIKDIEKLRKHLDLDKFFLLGTSYGSMVALGYAICYPSRLDGLVLIAGAASHHFIDDAKKNLVKYGTEEQIKISEKLWAGSFESEDEMIEFVKTMKPLYSMKAKKNELATSRKSESIIFPNYKSINLGFRSFLKTFDFRPKLKNIVCPTRIIVGEYDWINDPKHAKLMASLISGSELFILKGSGHFVAFDAHDKYIRLVNEFITKCNNVEENVS